MIGLAIALEDVVVKLVAIDVEIVLDVDAPKVVDRIADEFPILYKVSPFGPPHVKLELPAHVILQRPSVAGTLPVPNELPQ